MRVLAVGAHPDDLVILCGGTLARYAARGDDVTMVDIARGDRGSFIHSTEEIAAIRREESQKAAAVIGARYIGLGLSDGGIYSQNDQHRTAVIDIVRQARPDIIITHAPNDYMPDHNEVSALVFDASFLATLPLLETSSAAHDVVPPLYLMDTISGLDFAPTEFVDITETIEAKLEMLRAHQSQLTWLDDHDGIDIVDFVRSAARFRGGQAGVPYAEGFMAKLTWLRALHVPRIAVMDGSFRLITDWVDMHEADVLSLASGMVAIPSENRPPTGGELAFQRYFADVMTSAGMDVTTFLLDDVPDLPGHPMYWPGRDYRDRPVVVGRIPGSGTGRSLLLTGHGDVVPGVRGGAHEPFDPVVERGRLYGRGASDMKGGLAAAVMAVRCLQDLRI